MATKQLYTPSRYVWIMHFSLVPRRSEKADGTPGIYCLRMSLIYYWTIVLWTLVTTYGLGLVDDATCSRAIRQKICKPYTWLWWRWRLLAALVVCKLCLKLVAKQQPRTLKDKQRTDGPQERQQAFSCRLRRRKHKTQTNQRYS